MATSAVGRAPLDAHRLRLEHELTLVHGAIDLVASGGASRVTLVGLRSAERLLPRVQGIGHQRGLTVRAQWHGDDDGCDLTIEALQ